MKDLNAASKDATSYQHLEDRIVPNTAVTEFANMLVVPNALKVPQDSASGMEGGGGAHIQDVTRERGINSFVQLMAAVNVVKNRGAKSLPWGVPIFVPVTEVVVAVRLKAARNLHSLPRNSASSMVVVRSVPILAAKRLLVVKLGIVQVMVEEYVVSSKDAVELLLESCNFVGK